MNKRLVKAVMQMYEGANDAFNVKVGVHQGSVLLPYLSVIVMDVVCVEM